MSGWRTALLPNRGGDEDEAPPLSQHAWDASVVGLHITFALTIGLGVLTVISERSPAQAAAVLWSVAALATLVVAYLLAGARAIAGPAPARAVGYLVVLVVVLGIVARATPDALFVLFIAYPQVWFLVEAALPGTLWTLLLATSSTIGLVAHTRADRGSTPGAVSNMAIGLLFSLLLGIWMSRILEQSRSRAALIAELERTRGDLAAAHHDQGVMAERERLAREVHDTLAQGWTSIVVLSQTAAAELDRSPDHTRERLELIEEVARDNLRETRAVVAAFAPSELDGSTLVQALSRLVDRFARETGVGVQLDLDALTPGVTVSREQEVVLLRASQEALSNARRHAHATRVTLRLSSDSTQVALVVDDDGDGFDPQAAPGQGLAGLRRRLEQAGGQLDVTTVPGSGTTVAARLSRTAEAPR